VDASFWRTVRSSPSRNGNDVGELYACGPEDAELWASAMGAQEHPELLELLAQLGGGCGFSYGEQRELVEELRNTVSNVDESALMIDFFRTGEQFFKI
jgi:hypothetical protein